MKESTELGHSGASLPSGINLNVWIPSFATSVQMHFTSDETQTRSGFEVVVGCPVTTTTEVTTMWPDETTTAPMQGTVACHKSYQFLINPKSNT